LLFSSLGPANISPT